jgi:hypothetical protein
VCCAWHEKASACRPSNGTLDTQAINATLARNTECDAATVLAGEYPDIRGDGCVEGEHCLRTSSLQIGNIGRVRLADTRVVCCLQEVMPNRLVLGGSIKTNFIAREVLCVRPQPVRPCSCCRCRDRWLR